MLGQGGGRGWAQGLLGDYPEEWRRDQRGQMSDIPFVSLTSVVSSSEETKVGYPQGNVRSLSVLRTPDGGERNDWRKGYWEGRSVGPKERQDTCVVCWGRNPGNDVNKEGGSDEKVGYRRMDSRNGRNLETRWEWKKLLKREGTGGLYHITGRGGR